MCIGVYCIQNIKQKASWRHEHLDRLLHVDGLAQDCSISITNVLELLQSCTKSSM